MKNVYQLIAGFIGILMITQGCRQAAQTANPLPLPVSTLLQEPKTDGSLQPTLASVPTVQEVSPEAAAEALLDPIRVEEGVWFLLRGLGIGVYTGEGKQVLAGSETGPEDFWIYDFEISMLVRMALEPSRPFSEFSPQLNEIGVGSGQEETLKLYKDVYAANSSAYLVGLFTAMGLQFEGDPDITPLQEWLLLLDTFMPPNGSPNTGRGENSWMDFTGMGASVFLRKGTVLGFEVLDQSLQTVPCGWIQGGSFQANWGLVNSVIAAVDLIGAENIYYSIHGPLLARSVEGELRTNQDHAHEGHGAPGDKITFDVAIDINYGVGALIPIAMPTCGYLINLDPPLKSGDLPAVNVLWNIGPGFKNHGEFLDVSNHHIDGSQPTRTDPSGKTSITFQARQEPANGQGKDESLQETIRASFDPRAWIAAMGLKDPRLLAFLPPTINISPSISVMLEWHETVAYELIFDSTFVTNTFTPSGTSGPINITQQVRAVVPIEWSEVDQAFTGQALLDYVLFDVPPIIGYGGDNNYFLPCPNQTSATGGTFRVLQLKGIPDSPAPQPGQTQVPGLELTIDPGTTVESVVPVCPPPGSLPPGFSFPLLTWDQVFASMHSQETQMGSGPYIIKDWSAGSERIVAVKNYSYTNSTVSVLATTENTTITLLKK